MCLCLLLAKFEATKIFARESEILIEHADVGISGSAGSIESII